MSTPHVPHISSILFMDFPNHPSYRLPDMERDTKNNSQMDSLQGKVPEEMDDICIYIYVYIYNYIYIHKIL